MVNQVDICDTAFLRKNSGIAKLNAFLLLLILLDVIVHKLVVTIGITAGFIQNYNNLLFLFVVFLLLIKAINETRISKDILLVVPALVYSVFQISLRGLPISHIVQGFIYIQFIVYFVYFNSLSDQTKVRTIYYTGIYFRRLLWVVVLVALIEIFDPSMVRNIFWEGRAVDKGLGGLYLQSIFGSTTGLSQFCILLLFLHYAYMAIFRGPLLNKTRMITVFLLVFLSFSRKEALIVLVFYFYMHHIRKYGMVLARKLVAPIIVCSVLGIVYLASFFTTVNQVAISDTYVRLNIVDYSVQIFEEYFPFGSGVGTFGSQLSVTYTAVYEEFGIGPNITGYDGKRGPIYDAFFFSFTAEQGLGILIYLYIVIYMCRKPALKGSIEIRYLKLYMAFCLGVLCLFTPVLMNPFGFISFSLLGLLSTKASKVISSKDEKIHTNNC